MGYLGRIRNFIASALVVNGNPASYSIKTDPNGNLGLYNGSLEIAYILNFGGSQNILRIVGTTTELACLNVGGSIYLIDNGTSNVMFQITQAKVVKLFNIATAGLGLPPIYGATAQKSESATDASVLSYTPPATAGVYRVHGSLAVSASASGVIAVTLTWKDSNGTLHSAVPVTLYKKGVVAGSLGPTVAAGDVWDFYEDLDIDNSATAIVVGFTLTSGTVTLKLSSILEQLA